MDELTLRHKQRFAELVRWIVDEEDAKRGGKDRGGQTAAGVRMGGIGQSSVSKYQNGTRTPCLDTILKTAEALRLDRSFYDGPPGRHYSHYLRTSAKRADAPPPALSAFLAGPYGSHVTEEERIKLGGWRSLHMEPTERIYFHLLMGIREEATRGALLEAETTTARAARGARAKGIKGRKPLAKRAAEDD